MSSEAVLSAGMLSLTWIRFHPEKWTNANMMSPDCFRLLHMSDCKDCSIYTYLLANMSRHCSMLILALDIQWHFRFVFLLCFMTVRLWRLQMYPLGLRMQNDSLSPLASARSGYVRVPTLYLNREWQGFLSKGNSLWTDSTVWESEVWLVQKTRSTFVPISNMSTKLALHWIVHRKISTV